MFPPLSTGAHPQYFWPLLDLLGKRRRSGKARVNAQEPKAITLVRVIEKPEGCNTDTVSKCHLPARAAGPDPTQEAQKPPTATTL